MHSWTSALNAYNKGPDSYIIETFDRLVFLSHFHFSPKYCGLISDVDIPALAALFEITAMVLYHRRKNERRSASVSLLILSIRTDAIEVPRTPLLPLLKLLFLRLRPPKLEAKKISFSLSFLVLFLSLSQCKFMCFVRLLFI